MVTLGAVGVGSYFAFGGSGKKESEPPINAKNKEEESFVR
jgi:hypothetical protein